MTDTGTASAKIQIGQVMRQTFGVLGRNFPTFLILSLLLVGIPALIQALGQPRVNLGTVPAVAPANQLLNGVGSILFLIGYYILVGALTSGAVADLNGRKVGLSEALRVGLRRFWPLVGLVIVMSLGMVLGFLVLIVPGLWLLTAWSVVVPVKVVENVPFGQTFSRSLALTKGNRWRIFGLMLLYGLVILVVEGLFVVVAGGLRALLSSGVLVFVLPLANVLSCMVTATGTAALYFELRRVREGVGPEALASVFD